MQLERKQILERQKRAYFEGTVENINNEWVFFNQDTEEAFVGRLYS